MKHLNGEIVSVLDELVKVNQASELGFETAAEHAYEPALKVLLRDYARQRMRFAEELRAEIRAWGGVPQPKRNPLAALHRGWIDLKAGLTVGRTHETRVVLLESLRGERYALQRYQAAIQRPLPLAIVGRLEQQAASIAAVCDQLERAAECGEETLVLPLFPDSQSARAAAGRLPHAYLSRNQVQVTAVRTEQPYQCQCQRQRVLECVSAGTLSGAVIGSVTGLAVGIGLLLTGEVSSALEVMGFAVALAGGFGCLFGAIMGVVIGQGVLGQDAYVYAESLQRGGAVLAVASRRADRALVQTQLRQGTRLER